MREPSLQDRIGVRAFFVVLSPNANDMQQKPKSWERVGDNLKVAHDTNSVLQNGRNNKTDFSVE